MSKLDQPSPKQIAMDIESELQDACFEVAHGAVHYPQFYEDVEVADCPDATGGTADNLYNEADFIEGFIGDRIYDATGGDRELYNRVLDELEQGAHTAMKQAIKNLRKED